jgi:hypothetical protein
MHYVAPSTSEADPPVKGKSRFIAANYTAFPQEGNAWKGVFSWGAGGAVARAQGPWRKLSRVADLHPIRIGAGALCEGWSARGARRAPHGAARARSIGENVPTRNGVE